MQSKLPQVGTTIFTTMSALAAETGALNLSQGFPDFSPPLALLAALSEAANSGWQQYPPMIGLASLREAISAQIARYRGVSVDDTTEVTVVPGATEGIFCAITASVGAGDEVILLDPCYDSYEPAVLLSGGIPVHVNLDPQSFTPDWERIGSAITPRTRMIVINSPHNPTGTIWSHADMLALEALAEQYDLLVCSDEVYEFLVFDGQQHRSVLEYPALRARSFAHFSFGKTFSVTGWKTGYCIAPPALTLELRKVHQFVCFVGVTPIQNALATFMQTHPEYPAQLAADYQVRRDTLVSGLANSRFQLTPSAGTYFQLIDYSALSLESSSSLAERWAREKGLATIPLEPFYASPPDDQHLLRLCFAKTQTTLQQAVDILCAI